MERWLVGVDAGGTHTRAMAFAPASGTLGTAHGGGANWTVHGPDLCRERLEAVVREAVPAGTRPESLALSIAGYYPPDHGEAATRWAREIWPGTTVRLEPDVVGAWAGAFAGAPGIVLISGTGSIAFGKGPEGTEARAGGWGPLLGDPGSAYAVGVACLKVLADRVDGLAEATRLEDTVRARWPELGADLTRWIRGVYREKWGREQVARLAEEVSRSAEAGDRIAGGIIEAAGADLARMAGAVARRLGARGLPVALQGGLGEHSQPLRRAVTAHLEREAGSLELRAARYSPLEGALLLAAGPTWQRDLLRRLEHRDGSENE